jgi:hypothetical protein
MIGDRVRVLPRGGRWEYLGQDRYVGRGPEQLSYDFDRWGPNNLTFQIDRDPNIDQGDLQEFTPIEVIRGERIVWSGRTMETPGSASKSISVKAAGWQYHMDDQTFSKTYVHSDMTQFKDIKDYPGTLTGLSQATSNESVNVGVGEIEIRADADYVINNGGHGAAVLDLGPGNTGAYAFVDPNQLSQPIAPGAPTFELRIRASNAPDNKTSAGGGWAAGNFTDVGVMTGASVPPIGTGIAGSMGNRRYLHIIWKVTNSPTNPVQSGNFVRIEAVNVFGNSAWQASNVSNLHANDVLSDILQYVPQLQQDSSRIAVTTFDIPHLAFGTEEKTPREVAEMVNAYHGYRLRVSPDRYLEFVQQANRPGLVVNTNDQGVTFQDASTNSGSDVYSRVIARGQTGAGQPIKATATSTNPLNPLVQRGYNRDKVIDVQFAVDQVTLQSLADVTLAAASASKLKGSLEIKRDGGIRTLVGDGPIRMSTLGDYVGELILVENLIDPDTGGMGRIAQIVGVTVGERSIQLSLDNERDSLNALLNRMGVVRA